MYHRFNIDNKTWGKIEPRLTEQRRQYDGIVKDNRKQLYEY